MYQGDYQLIGQELSFFTQKLEAQLRFQRLPWRWQFKTQECGPELGTWGHAFYSSTANARHLVDTRHNLHRAYAK